MIFQALNGNLHVRVCSWFFQVQRAVEGLEVTRVRRAYSFLVESLKC